MEARTFICIICPRGCHLTGFKDNENEDYQVKGNFCKRGLDYGLNELLHPKRVITSTVRIEGAIYPRLPVMTEQSIPKNLIFKVMDVINQVRVHAPIHQGDIIIKNVLNTGVNLVASRSMYKGCD